MTTTRAARAAAAACVLTLVMAAPLGAQQPQQRVTGPVATYWVSAKTMGGMAAMGGGGGIGGAMRMAMGGGPGADGLRMLQLDLGSTRPPGAQPKADHFIPPGMRMGQSLPLKLHVQPPRAVAPGPDDIPRPRGRMLIFWGCGERAGPGQPVVIDFARVARGEWPADYAALRSITVNAPEPPRPGRTAAFADWPNDLDRRNTAVADGASLIGDHVVRATYAPEIRFTLNQDFMPALDLRQQTLGSKAVQMSWGLLAPATGYHLQSVGMRESDTGGEPEQIVFWSSSQVRAVTGDLADYIPPGEVARLVRERAVLSPQTATCTIPAEVLAAGPMTSVFATAYGPEVNSAFPPRPADPRQPWNIEYTTKARFMAQSMAIAGMDLSAVAGGREGREEPPRTPEEQRRGNARRVLQGLGGIIPR